MELALSLPLLARPKHPFSSPENSGYPLSKAVNSYNDVAIPFVSYDHRDDNSLPTEAEIPPYLDPESLYIRAVMNPLTPCAI